jgi:hypothetical protein
MCIVAVKSIGDWPWRWGMLYTLICDGTNKSESNQSQRLKLKYKMRSRGRMLVDLLLTRSNDQVRALIVPWSGVSSRSTGWWAPVAQHTIRERWGPVAQITRFAATPPETLTDPKGSVVSDGKSTAGVTALPTRWQTRAPPPIPTRRSVTSTASSLFLSPVSVPWYSTGLFQMASYVPARSTLDDPTVF